MSKDEVMKQWFDSLSPDEQVLARKSLARNKREMREYMRERIPQPVRFSYGTSTPHYKVIIETSVKV